MDRYHRLGASFVAMSNMNQQYIATLRAVTQKKPIPEIDFTCKSVASNSYSKFLISPFLVHTMEDGTQVSTQERVCKGVDIHSAV